MGESNAVANGAFYLCTLAHHMYVLILYLVVSSPNNGLIHAQGCSHKPLYL